MHFYARSTLIAALLLGASCNKNVEEGATLPASSAPAPQAQEASAQEGQAEFLVKGTINVSPEIAAALTKQELLFIVARPPGAEGSPPLAVKRIQSPAFPYAFEITRQDMMMQGRPVSDTLIVTARIDKDGVAGPAASGDHIGSTPNAVQTGDPSVNILIDQTVP